MTETLALLLPGVGWEQFAWMIAMVFGAALLQGIGGVGFAMVSAPISVLAFPELVPGPLLVLGAGLATLGAVRERYAINWRFVVALMSGRIGGSLAAGAVLYVLSAEAFSVLFALLILAGVGFSLSGWKIKTSTPNMVATGIASGLMGTITSSGAPPVAIAMQHMPPAELRATVSAFFVMGALFSLVTLAVVGRFGGHELRLGLVLLPAMAVGFLASGPLNRIVSRQMIRMSLLALSALGALAILAKAIA